MTTTRKPELAAGPDTLLARYRAMARIRAFEQAVERLLAEGRIGGTTHLCIGQEAVAVGACAALRQGDLVVSHHRGHGHLLAKGAEARRLMAELAGRVTGYCQGKGGSQHTAVPFLGHMGSNGITGGGIPIATGLALASRMRGMGITVLCFFGDGACHTGNFHESLNMAALWRLPIVYLCENNLYAMSTRVRDATACTSLADWAARYEGMAAESVDGQDVLAVEAATRRLVERARALQGPGFLECRTYRQCGHSKSDPRRYRTREEEEQWAARDPIRLLRLRIGGVIAGAEAKLEGIASEVEAEIEDAVRFALESPPGDRETALGGVLAPDEPR